MLHTIHLTRNIMMFKNLLVFLTTAAILWVSCYADAPECVSSDDDEDGLAELYEDPDNCGAFYECSHGIAYEMFCSEGLMYNTELEVCDYARNVDCGTRPVPSS